MASKILGLAKLDRKLKRLPTVARTAIRSAMEQGADEMVALAKSLVPVDSGALRDSIGWTWGKAPKGAMTLAKLTSNNLAADLTLTIFVGSRDKSLGDRDAYYARWVEFGTINMPAQPYFYVSWRALKKRIRGRVTRSMNKAAKKVAASA